MLLQRIENLENELARQKNEDSPTSKTYASMAMNGTKTQQTSPTTKPRPKPQPQPPVNQKVVHKIHLKPSAVEPSTKLKPFEMAELKQKLEKSIPGSELNFAVDRMRPAAKGGLVMEFRTHQEKKNAIESLTKPSSQLGLVVKDIKIVPRIIIKGIPSYIKKEEIVPLIQEDNSNIHEMINSKKETLVVVTCLPNRHSPSQLVILEASPKLNTELISAVWECGDIT